MMKMQTVHTMSPLRLHRVTLLIASLGRCQSLISLGYFFLFLYEFAILRSLDQKSLSKRIYWFIVVLWATFAIAGHILINVLPLDSTIDAALELFAWKRTSDLASREQILLFLWSFTVDLAVLFASAFAAVSGHRTAQQTQEEQGEHSTEPQLSLAAIEPGIRYLRPDYLAAQCLGALAVTLLPCLLSIPHLLFVSSAAQTPATDRSAAHRLRFAGTGAAVHLLLLFFAQIVDAPAIFAAAAGSGAAGWACAARPQSTPHPPTHTDTRPTPRLDPATICDSDSDGADGWMAVVRHLTPMGGG